MSNLTQFDIACFSHLGWDPQLFQRPQQLMTQLAEMGNLVLYAGCIGQRRFFDLQATGATRGSHGADLRFLNLPVSPWPGTAAQVTGIPSRIILDQETREQFSTLPDSGSSRPRVAWLYHPALLPTANRLNPDLIVYDVMDCFASFEKHREHVHEAEQQLLARADVIFTGGRSLHRMVLETLAAADLDMEEVYCFPSGVDLDHFSTTQHNNTVVAPEVSRLPPPVLGYFGAIDERIDFDLLAAVATARPKWNIVLIGPVLRRPDALPQNIHFPGAKPYSTLPQYLKGFDVCLMPFLSTELVAHCSPTKTPEYLAGGKPVVSTAIPDVMKDYGDVVSITKSSDEFLAACEHAVNSPPDPEYLQSAARARSLTWNGIAAKMHEIIREKSEQLHPFRTP